MTTARNAAVTDEEFTTHVWPIASDEWTIKHGHYPSTDAEFDEVDALAAYLRVSFSTGELNPSWR